MSDISACLDAIKLAYNQEQLKSYEIYLRELLSYNQFVNILGTNDRELVIKKHLLDVLIGQNFFKGYRNIADIGAGSGFPGVPLAIVYSNSTFSLIESKEKKVYFLKDLKSKLMLKNIDILHINVNEVKTKYDVITCRAFASIKKIRKMTMKMCHSKTKYILFKGKKEKIEEEIAEVNSKTFECIRVQNPFLEDRERNIVVCQF